MKKGRAGGGEAGINFIFTGKAKTLVHVEFDDG